MRFKTGILVIVFLSLGTCSPIRIWGQKEPKALPKQVGLTEIQRLKDDALQSKIALLNRDLNDLIKQRTELLKGALEGAGVTGPAIERYQYDQARFVFTLLPEPSPEPVTPPEVKSGDLKPKK